MATLFETRALGDDLSSDDDEAMDLGVGTSTGAGYKGLGGARPLTIAALLENRVVFVAAQHASTADEIPYTPINVKSVVPVAVLRKGLPPLPPSSPTSLAPSPVSIEQTSVSDVPSGFDPISPSVGWHKQLKVGSGLENVGNTCFLNSALQVLLHTAPLVRYAQEGRHDSATCQTRLKKRFCMTCSLPGLISKSFEGGRSSYSPLDITKNLKSIAKHLKVGRQEDAHEFLRFCIDNMQVAELFGKPPKAAQRLKDTTFVHQIFGGRLRSRVVCGVCQHPSDTFDSMLDLSLDVQRVDSIKEALATFVKIDQLRGSNKYKCEKCKKLVNADKSFTIEDAPMVLTIHLKRFTATGRKISEQIKYPEILHLGPYMSDRASNPTYKLYGVINHSGGGPHSGHYTAHVKSSAGPWYSMNDDMVTKTNDGKPPLNSRNAYVLTYCREQGDALKNAIMGGTSNGATQTNGKRPRESNEYNLKKTEIQPPSHKKQYTGPQVPQISIASPSLSRPLPPPPSSSSPASHPNQKRSKFVSTNPFDVSSRASSSFNDDRPSAGQNGTFQSKAAPRMFGGGGNKGGNKKISTVGSMKVRNKPHMIHG